MKPSVIGIAVLLLLLTLCVGSYSSTAHLDMFNRKETMELYQFDYFAVNNNTNNTIPLEEIAEYQTALWTSIIIVFSLILAIWFVSKIDYSEDIMLYASELRKN